MGSDAQGAVRICRCDWYTIIHCLGAEQRCLKTKINTDPNFLEMEKTHSGNYKRMLYNSILR